jgi:hypothetical protein
VVTVTSTVPGIPGGDFTVIIVELTFSQINPGASTAPNLTILTIPGKVPSILTSVPPPAGPESGEILETKGIGKGSGMG